MPVERVVTMEMADFIFAMVMTVGVVVLIVTLSLKDNDSGGL